MALDSALLPSYHIQARARPRFLCLESREPLRGPLSSPESPFSVPPAQAGYWEGAAAVASLFSCLQCRLLTACLSAALEASPKHANLMVSGQPHTLRDFPSRIKSQVLSKKR